MPEYRVKGALFENERDTGPAFSGVIEIDNVKTFITCWPKKSAAGKNYLQISEDRKKAASSPATGGGGRSPFQPRKPTQQPNLRGAGSLPHDDMDEDIPFAPEFR